MVALLLSQGNLFELGLPDVALPIGRISAHAAQRRVPAGGSGVGGVQLRSLLLSMSNSKPTLIMMYERWTIVTTRMTCL